MNSMGRMALIPLVIGMGGFTLIVPLMPVLLVTEPSLENLFVVLFSIGVWPYCVSFLHGMIFVEHFISRSISEEFITKHNLVFDPFYSKLPLRGGDYLSIALDGYSEHLDTEIMRRGRVIVKRHNAIAGLIWPGLAMAGIAAVGLALIQVL